MTDDPDPPPRLLTLFAPGNARLSPSLRGTVW
jgi:hypothetical protein